MSATETLNSNFLAWMKEAREEDLVRIKMDESIEVKTDDDGVDLDIDEDGGGFQSGMIWNASSVVERGMDDDDVDGEEGKPKGWDFDMGDSFDEWRMMT